MIYGLLLAGGIGSRMGNVETPKQFLSLNGKPIIVHTLEKFFVVNEFERIIVLCPAQWIEYTRELVKKYFKETDKIMVTNGGDTRNETILNGINLIESEYGLDEKTIIVTHDSVRPFVTHRILKENILGAEAHGACDTVIPASDTIIESEDGRIISNIPNRVKMYQGQTPQSFQAQKLKELYLSLNADEKQVLTDAAKIFVIKGHPVHLVEGEVFNIKITYPYDLQVAETLIKGEK